MILLLESDDDAVIKLAKHFEAVIGSIVDGYFLHLSFPSRGYIFGHDEVPLTVDPSPSLVFPSPNLLLDQLNDVRSMFTSTLHSFDYGRFTPLLRRIIGDTYVGLEDSGIGVLERRPKRGRPPKESTISSGSTTETDC